MTRCLKKPSIGHFKAMVIIMKRARMQDQSSPGLWIYRPGEFAMTDSYLSGRFKACFGVAAVAIGFVVGVSAAA